MGDKAIASKLEKLRLEQQEAGDEDREEDGDDEEEFGEPFRPLNKFEVYRMRALQKIDQVRAETIEVEYEKERVALEAKYIALRKPLEDDRAQILAGTKAVPQEDDEETADLPAPEKDEGIPKFWLGVLAQSAFSQHFGEDDLPVLEHLTNMTTTYSEDFKSFTLHMHFSENPFFSNAVLTKTYTFDTTVFAEDPNLQDIGFSAIEWKDGKDVTMKEVKKTQKQKSGKNKGQKRTIVVKVPQASFFHWFSKSEETPEEEEEEEQEDKATFKFDTETDYDLAHYALKSVIPDAVKYFMGEYAEDDMYGDEEDDEEDDEEEEEDDEEDGPPPPKGRRGKQPVAAFQPPANGENPPECKQN